MVSKEVEKLLLKVQKPGRYVGGELNEVIKDKNSVDVRFAFCFPDIYISKILCPQKAPMLIIVEFHPHPEQLFSFLIFDSYFYNDYQRIRISYYFLQI